MKTYGTVQQQLYMSTRGTREVYMWDMQGACMGHAGTLRGAHEHHAWYILYKFVCTYHQATIALHIPLTVSFTLYDLECMYTQQPLYVYPKCIVVLVCNT